MIRSVLEYGASTWSPYFKKDIDLLEGVQNRCLRLANEEIMLPTLSQRRLFTDLCDVYKYMHGYFKSGAEELFHRAERQLGGHSLKLNRPYAKTLTRSNFFSIRVVTRWNALPEQVVQAASLAQFKERLSILLNE